MKRQRYYCTECKKVRLAKVEYYDWWKRIKITCSQGHVEDRNVVGKKVGTKVSESI